MANPLVDESYMLLALREARKNLKSMAGGPFGACIVKNGRVLALARNTVLKNDATCHAEMNAIRLASRKLGTFDLSGCVIYSTTEPCPMCFSAIHWARMRAIVYGTTTEDAARLGFGELRISDTLLKRLGKSKVVLRRSPLRAACEKLLADWKALPGRKTY